MSTKMPAYTISKQAFSKLHEYIPPTIQNAIFSRVILAHISCKKDSNRPAIPVIFAAYMNQTICA